jgi:hypothetical protein
LFYNSWQKRVRSTLSAAQVEKKKKNPFLVFRFEMEARRSNLWNRAHTLFFRF